MKKKVLIFLAALALLAAGTGIGILAAESGYGSQSDPLITLSYVNSILKPELESKTSEALEKTARELSGKLEEKVAAYESSVRELVGSGSSLPTTDVFQLVTLEDGDTVICARGTEIMLRIGTARAWGEDSPALVDTTSGDTLDDGDSMKKNHLYMVTINDCGFTATDDPVKLLIRGSYTIS